VKKFLLGGFRLEPVGRAHQISDTASTADRRRGRPGLQPL